MSEPKTLRDEFAIAALQAMVSNTDTMLAALEGNEGDGLRARGWMAHTAYQFADAMLKARES